MTGSQVTAAFLDEAGVPYEFVEHPPSMSAGADADVTGHRRDETAKVVVLHDGDRYIAAVVAASERLDVHKVRDLFDAGRQLRLASEAEIAADFPQFEVGAMPPLGPGVPPVEVIDRELVRRHRLLCAAGDHRHSVVIDPSDLLRLTSAVTADIRED